MNLLTTETFDQNALSALEDTQLRGALRNATSLFRQRRLVAAQSLENWEELRSLARSIKDEVLLHLDKYLDEFAIRAEARGAVVHWARDAAEANELICRIATERQAKTVVKSKSMVTEEIHLNKALEQSGIDAIETDLGEYIIQLAGETPSHIIVPAIHKTKGQIAQLFTEKLGIEPTDDVAVLTSTARSILRDYFARAEIGISGVNFGVAETGTILILENEGNIRLTTSLPKLHIAVMGIEKVIPRFQDLDVFLKLLPRSGTGQNLTTYQSIITGKKQNSEEEGPEELHIVLLDNGRSRMLAHPVTRQSLACIRCGACLNACPVYQQIGGHAYGSVYPGPIGAVITPQLIGLQRAGQLPYASSLCGACREVCPVKIDIPELLLHLRSELAEGHVENVSPLHTEKRTAERLAFKLWAMLVGRAWIYERIGRVARVMQRFVIKDGRLKTQARWMTRFASPLTAWAADRNIRPIERQTFREAWRKEMSARRDG